MIKKILLFSISAFIAFFVTKSIFAGVSIPICHASGNQYVRMSVDASLLDGIGANDHNRNQHQQGKDIIPPGYWDTDGRNWTQQGRIIWANNCKPLVIIIPTVVPSIAPSITPIPQPTIIVPTIVIPTISIPKVWCHINIINTCSESNFIGNSCPLNWLPGKCL